MNSTKSIYASYLERQFLSGVRFVAIFVGLLGNLTVIYAILTTKKLQTKTNVFVFNLAMADIVTISVIAPIQAVAVLNDELTIPSWLCDLGANLTLVCIGCSVNTLTLIAVNRLIGITTTASKYHKLYTPFKLSLMIFASWGVPTAVATLPHFTDYATYGFNPIYKSCSWKSKTSDIITFAKFICIVYFPIQFTILFLSYLKMFLYVRKTTRAMLNLNNRDTHGVGPQTLQMQLLKRQVKVTKNLFTVVCVFIIFMSPFFATLGLLTDVAKSLLSHATMIATSNSAVNPIIYGTKHPDFRAAFARIFRCRAGAYRLRWSKAALSNLNGTSLTTISASVSQEPT